MPWVVRDAVRDINRAVARRWQAIDPLLPDPSPLPAGCGEPLVVNGGGGRVTGLGVCVHQQIPADSLNQTWGPAERFTLVPRLSGRTSPPPPTNCSPPGAITSAGSAPPAAPTPGPAWSGRVTTPPACGRWSGTGWRR
jgi:hypothetical protein